MLVFFYAQPSVHCSDLTPCYKCGGFEEKEIEKAICGSFIVWLFSFNFLFGLLRENNVYEADFFFGRFEEFF